MFIVTAIIIRADDIILSESLIFTLHLDTLTSIESISSFNSDDRSATFWYHSITIKQPINHTSFIVSAMNYLAFIVLDRMYDSIKLLKIMFESYIHQ